MAGQALQRTLFVNVPPQAAWGYTGSVRLRPPDPENFKFVLASGEAIQKLALAVEN